MSLSPDALAAFRAAVGEANVTSSANETEARSRATFGTKSRVAAIVRPANRAEVQACLRIANAERIAVHPVSRGRNWGYGTSVPYTDGAVLLDLARMDRIVAHDERLGYVVVEPGVTPGQLVAYLEANGSTLFAPIGGAPADVSLVGNALDRGMAKSRYGDRYESICGLEVVLPNGEVLETGYGRFPNAKAAHVSRTTMGPVLDGLFSQSSFGVVTRMTFWLPQKPSHFRTFFYSADRPEQLPGLVDAVQSLYAKDILRSPTLLGNDYRWLSFVRQYPWAEMNGKTPLSETLLAKLRKEAGRGVWNGDGALYCESAAHARALKTIVQETLAPHVSRMIFFDPLKARLALAAGWVKYFTTGNDIRRLMRLAFSKSVYRGNVIEGTLATLYWRKKSPPPETMDPERDGCGLISYDVVLPAAGEDAVAAERIVRRECARFDYEPNMAFNFGRGKSAYLTGQLQFDRDVEGEDERAQACHDALVAALRDAGYYSCRQGVMSDGMIAPEGSAYRKTMRDLKELFDPNAILSPGKLAL